MQRADAQVTHRRCQRCRHQGLYGFFFAAFLGSFRLGMFVYRRLGGRFTKVAAIQGEIYLRPLSRDITPEQRSLEAGQWFEDRRGGRQLSDVELQAWERWSADPGNMAEYEAIAQFDVQLKRILPRQPLPSAAEHKGNHWR